MKLYYITGHDHMDECGGVCINQVHRMFKTREAAESCLALHIKDVRDYLWYLHKEDGVSYTDEVRTKNGCIDFFIAEAIYASATRSNTMRFWNHRQCVRPACVIQIPRLASALTMKPKRTSTAGKMITPRRRRLPVSQSMK